jgi:hypothetical protein
MFGRMFEVLEVFATELEERFDSSRSNMGGFMSEVRRATTIKKGAHP